MLKVSTDGVDAVRKALAGLARDEIPTAMRNLVNDTARDIIKREEQEIQRVFDRPTRLMQKPFWLSQKATKEKPTATISIKDVYGRRGRAIGNALEPHIPGYENIRESKGMERALRHRGLLGRNQYLVPSRTMKLNKFGNITGATASKMLNDIGAFKGVAGFESTTKSSKAKYIWGTAKTRSGKTVTGIWIVSRWRNYQPAALAMVVVNKPPTYKKRFDFFGIANEHADKVMPKHARLAFEHAIRRRAGR